MFLNNINMLDIFICNVDFSNSIANLIYNFNQTNNCQYD